MVAQDRRVKMRPPIIERHPVHVTQTNNELPTAGVKVSKHLNDFEVAHAEVLVKGEDSHVVREQMSWLLMEVRKFMNDIDNKERRK